MRLEIFIVMLFVGETSCRRYYDERVGDPHYDPTGKSTLKPGLYRICSDDDIDAGVESRITTEEESICPNLIRPRAVPTLLELGGSLNVKKAIFIAGKPQNQRTFTFHFLYDPSCSQQGSFIPLQIKINMEERNITRNTLISGEWGPTETTLIDVFPFMDDQLFQLTIRLSDEEFIVYINGQHSFDYHHRLPYQNIRRLRIEGNVQLFSFIIR